MENKMTEAVSIGKRRLPELFVRKRGSQFADASRVCAIAVDENGCKRRVQVGHFLSCFAGKNTHVLHLNHAGGFLL
jgi:hypothetical protein